MRYYFISLAIHGAVLGLLTAVMSSGVFTPPEFALRHGYGPDVDGFDDFDAPRFEGQVRCDAAMTIVRMNPIAAALPEHRESLIPRGSESDRAFAPVAEARPSSRDPEPDLARPVPPTVVAKPPASPVRTDSLATPLPLERQAAADDMIASLVRTSLGGELGEISSAEATAASPGGRRRGGDPDGLPAAWNSNVRPPYPAEALARGIEGVVLLRVMIGADGRVRRARLESSSGDASLDDSALTTVRDSWRFEPARRNGAAVEFEVLVPIRFRARG